MTIHQIMGVHKFQIAYEALFAGKDYKFNKKLCFFIKNEFSELPEIEDFFQMDLIFKGQQEPKVTFLNLIISDMGREQTLIHIITSFLADSSYDPFTKNRQIRSVEWTIKLAKRLRCLYSNRIESSFHSILFAHSLIRLFLNLNFIEKPSTDKSKSHFDVLLNDDSNGNNTQTRYKLHDKINQFIGDYELNNVLLRNLPSPLKVPMLSPPKPHKTAGKIVTGAYQNSIFSESVSDKMLRGILGKAKNEKKSNNFDSNRVSALQFSDNSKALKSINILQQVPWVYNEMMLKLLKRIERPQSISEEEQKKNLREDISLKNIDNFLKLCTKVKASKMYYPWYFDYRGRIYCSKIQFSYQGEGLPRALHLFSESKKVTDETILLEYVKKKFELSANSKLSLADLKKAMGKHEPKKESEFFQKLVPSSNQGIPYKYFKSHVCDILEKCGNITPELTFNREHWSLIATLMEFEYYWSNEQEWRLPLPLDATCNGQQHISAIVQNNNIAKLTRLFESNQESLDLYEHIANLTHKNLEQDPEYQSNIPTEHDIGTHINRKNMKGSIMKLGYGAVKYTIIKELISNPFVFPISLWKDQPTTQTDMNKAGEDFNLLLETPSPKVRKAKYFYAPHWAASDRDRKKQNNIRKKGYYPAEKKYLDSMYIKISYEGADMEERKLIEERRQLQEQFTEQFDSDIMTYEQAIENQRQRLKVESDKKKRNKVIKLLAKHLVDLCVEELPLAKLKEHLEAIYDGYVMNNVQQLTNSNAWFSYFSELVGVKVCFVALKSIPGFTEKQKKAFEDNSTLEFKRANLKQLKKNQGYTNIGMETPGIRKIKYLQINPSHSIKGTINLKLRINELKERKKMRLKWLPSYIHALDATHLHLIVNKWNSEGLGPLATIHDSFGMHPNDVQRFRELARETFIQLHKTEPLRQFYNQCGLKVPANYPNNPDFDIEEVGLNMFSF